MQPITLQEIEEMAGVAASGRRRSFTRLAGFAEADAEAIVFAQDAETVEQALGSGAGLILAPLDAAGSARGAGGIVVPVDAAGSAGGAGGIVVPVDAAGSAGGADPRLLRVAHPKWVFALCGQWLERYATPVVHPAAQIDPAASVGMGTAVGAGCVIEAGAVIGRQCRLGANVTVHGCVTLGDRVMVQAGAVLGGLGFGYVRGEDGAYVRFPQQGTLVVEEDVEIGANTTIDRGALGETRVGRGTKIDNLVQIGHNCRIGRDVIIAAQVGVSGSCTIGDGVVLAGQVGLGDHVQLGAGITIGGQGGVYPGKSLSGPGAVFAGTPAEPVREFLRSLARLRRLR